MVDRTFLWILTPLSPTSSQTAVKMLEIERRRSTRTADGDVRTKRLVNREDWSRSVREMASRHSTTRHAISSKLSSKLRLSLHCKFSERTCKLLYARGKFRKTLGISQRERCTNESVQNVLETTQRVQTSAEVFHVLFLAVCRNCNSE